MIGTPRAEQVWLIAAGPDLQTADGRPVTLRGVGVGGWMNMENFITGYPATETLQRSALRSVLGAASCQRFFDRLLADFWADGDAALIASLGMNSVRLPVNYRHLEDDAAPFEIREEGFQLLDRAIDTCRRHSLYSIIDLHSLPGAQNQHWHSDNPTHWAFFWDHRHFQDRVVALWQAIARRYRDNPWVAGYNLINEPADPSGQKLWPFYCRLRDAVREIDPRHLLFLDGDRYGTDFTAFREAWPDTVYACHDYALPGFADGGPYPGISRGQYVDAAVVEETFLARSQFMRDRDVPVWVGEFGPVYTGEPGRDTMRYDLLRDQLAGYERHGAGWSLWTYKDIGLQGLVHAKQGSPYLQRIQPVLAAKRRLGSDAWGTVGDELPELMGCIREIFDREFAGFDPYPFGRDRWIDTLVKHILFAEPLVGQFARCFEGATDAELGECASSFALANCERREPLLRLLRLACGEDSAVRPTRATGDQQPGRRSIGDEASRTG